jgi:hypothetical protein
MPNNPLQKKKSLTQKVSEGLHLPHKQTPQEKFLKKFQQVFLYIALFLAGYIVAKIQILMG